MSQPLAGPAPAGPVAVAAPWPPTLATTALAAATAAAVLAGASTGSAVVAAVLLGIAVADRRAGAAALLAVLAGAVRFRTAALDDLAGIQSVLGLSVEVGPATAAASAGLGAAAVVLAVGPLPDARGWVRLAPAVPAGLLAAALAAGPGPDQLGLRVLTSAAGVAVAGVLVALDLRGGAADAARAAVARSGGRLPGQTGPAPRPGLASPDPVEPRPGKITAARRWLAVAAGVAAVVLAGWPT